jgi:hypothetical protein
VLIEERDDPDSAHGAARMRASQSPWLVGRWMALGAWVAVIYASLPFGPRVGLAVLRTPVGSWVLGPGLTVVAVGGAAILMRGLRRRGAPGWAYATLAAAAVAYAVAFAWLRAQRLERTHLPEYGIVAWLAWRALEPVVPGRVAPYAAAAVLGAAIGWGDELLQGVLPGRYYDLRDVAMNALGSTLAVVVLAAVSAGSSARRSRRAAGSSPR